MSEIKTGELKKLLARVTPDLHRQIRMLAAELDRSMQDLVVEAITDLLEKHGRVVKH